MVYSSGWLLWVSRVQVCTSTLRNEKCHCVVHYIIRENERISISLDYRTNLADSGIQFWSVLRLHKNRSSLRTKVSRLIVTAASRMEEWRIRARLGFKPVARSSCGSWNWEQSLHFGPFSEPQHRCTWLFKYSAMSIDFVPLNDPPGRLYLQAQFTKYHKGK